jgi:cytochrome bd-type quinol oxidase subunit 2
VDLPDALLLARIQSAFTVSIHFLFPAITIGMASHMTVFEGQWLRTGRTEYMDLFRYWVKIFALAGTERVELRILCYTAWSYWVFRGKVNDEGYHA